MKQCTRCGMPHYIQDLCNICLAEQKEWDDALPKDKERLSWEHMTLLRARRARFRKDK